MIRNKCVVITHGKLAETLLDTIANIIGTQADCVTLSNNGLSLQELTERIKLELCEDCENFLITDFPGSSCYVAAKKVEIACSGCYALAGVNLPMLLSFFNKRKTLSGEQLRETVLEAGNRGIKK